MFINKDLIRWALLIGAAPIWIPYLRILWRDFNHALRDEGGLIGIAPQLVDQVCHVHHLVFRGRR